MNVDCEGHDLAILRSLDFKRYRPKVIAVESHMIDIADLLKSDLYEFLHAKDYMLVNRAGFTCIFADPQFIGSKWLV